MLNQSSAAPKRVVITYERMMAFHIFFSKTVGINSNDSDVRSLMLHRMLRIAICCKVSVPPGGALYFGLDPTAYHRGSRDGRLRSFLTTTSSKTRPESGSKGMAVAASLLQLGALHLRVNPVHSVSPERGRCLRLISWQACTGAYVLSTELL